MSEVENVLRSWLALDDDQVAECAAIIRQAVEVDQVREQADIDRSWSSDG